MERCAFWSQQLDDNSAKKTPAFWRSSDFTDIRPLYLHHIIWYAEMRTRVLP